MEKHLEKDTWLEMTFRRKVRGVNPKDVEAFREKAAARVKEMLEENTRLRTHITRLETRMKSGLAMEQKLTRMLHEMEEVTKRITEQAQTHVASAALQSEFERRVVLQNARKEAAVVIRDAENRAEQIMRDSTGRVQTVMDQIGMLHGRRVALIARLKALLLTQMEFLDALQTDVQEPFQDAPDIPPAAREGLGMEDLRSIIQKLESQEERNA